MQAQTQQAKKQAKKGCKQFRVGSDLVAVGIIGFYRANAASPDSMQTTFATPAAAGQALLAAAQSQDEKALEKILGPDSQAIFKPGDAKEDEAALKSFVVKFDEMNRWVKMTDGSEILNIGADNYAFPIPLVQDKSLNWHFDTKAGQDEILTRQIGRNELLAIDAVSAIANAEELYAQRPHHGNPAGLYTTTIFSSAGKQDGLYWPVADGESRPAPGPRGNIRQGRALHSERIANHRRLLVPHPHRSGWTSQRRREIVYRERRNDGRLRRHRLPGETATPASRNAFIVNRDAVVYQQDLGPEH